MARFHLGNGAILERINFLGDQSDKALKTAAGLMVNYKYNLESIEQNHEEYYKNKTIICSQSVNSLKRSFLQNKRFKII